MKSKANNKTQLVSIVIFNEILKKGNGKEHIKYFSNRQLMNVEKLSSQIEESYNRIIKETGLKLSQKIGIGKGNFYENKTQNIIFSFEYNE